MHAYVQVCISHTFTLIEILTGRQAPRAAPRQPQEKGSQRPLSKSRLGKDGEKASRCRSRVAAQDPAQDAPAVPTHPRGFYLSFFFLSFFFIFFSLSLCVRVRVRVIIYSYMINVPKKLHVWMDIGLAEEFAARECSA